jgi:tRNA(fMet)-specific endonuclease VapC
MTRFVLDTGIAGLYLDRKRGVFDRAEAEVARGNRVGIAGPVLAELAFRAEGSPKRERNLERFRQALAVWKLWLPDTETAFEYGRIAFELKKLGRPNGQNDIWIAAIALTLGNAKVVTTDSDLSAVPSPVWKMSFSPQVAPSPIRMISSVRQAPASSCTTIGAMAACCSPAFYRPCRNPLASSPRRPLRGCALRAALPWIRPCCP